MLKKTCFPCTLWAGLGLHGAMYSCHLFSYLRMFARKVSNIDFFLRILPLKVDELVISEM